MPRRGTRRTAKVCLNRDLAGEKNSRAGRLGSIFVRVAFIGIVLAVVHSVAIIVLPSLRNPVGTEAMFRCFSTRGPDGGVITARCAWRRGAIAIARRSIATSIIAMAGPTFAWLGMRQSH
jgi:hypothetical protein